MNPQKGLLNALAAHSYPQDLSQKYQGKLTNTQKTQFANDASHILKAAKKFAPEDPGTAHLEKMTRNYNDYISPTKGFVGEVKFTQPGINGNFKDESSVLDKAKNFKHNDHSLGLMPSVVKGKNVLFCENNRGLATTTLAGQQIHGARKINSIPHNEFEKVKGTEVAFDKNAPRNGPKTVSLIGKPTQFACLGGRQPIDNPPLLKSKLNSKFH